MNSDSTERLGRYEILEEIGRGAMGVVYLAQDPLIGRRVAVKVFRVGFSASDDELRNLYARFIREAQSAGILSHPNIVTVHDVAQAEGDSPAFIAMEYVEGRTLKQLLDSSESISRSRVIDLMLQVTLALDYAHSMGVVHRDIKPGNILFTDDDKVKITDFGIALVNAGNITNHGQLLGTPSYMAPEAIEEKEVDHRADLFSLGVVLYELLTRHKPFAGKSMTKVTHRIVYEPFTPPRGYVADLPADLEAVLDRALDKAPEGRYQTAAQLGRALEEAREGVEVLPQTAAIESTLDDTAPADTQSVDFEVDAPRGPGPAARLKSVLRRKTPIGNVPMWLLAGGVLLGVSAGYALSRYAAGARQEIATHVAPARVGALEPLAARTRQLEAMAQARIEAGDTDGAYLALSEAVRIDSGSSRLRQRLDQVETERRAQRDQWQVQMGEYLLAARRALDNGRVRDSTEFADRAQAFDPMSVEASELIVEARAAGARIRARRSVAPPPAVVPEIPIEPLVEPEPVVEPTVEEEPPAPVATPGILAIELSAARSPGVITLYEGEAQIFRERFKFIAERKGLLNKGLLRSLAAKGGAGEMRRELMREHGDMSLRLYVSMPGSPTQVVPLEAYLKAGGSLSLSIVIDPSGRATAHIR